MTKRVLLGIVCVAFLGAHVGCGDGGSDEKKATVNPGASGGGSATAPVQAPQTFSPRSRGYPAK